MPTYTYECQACGKSFDELQAMTEPKLSKCPKCHKNKLVCLIGSGSGMIFKGTGFYETDYKKKPAPAGDKKEPSKPAANSNPTPVPTAPCGSSCACHP